MIFIYFLVFLVNFEKNYLNPKLKCIIPKIKITFTQKGFFFLFWAWYIFILGMKQIFFGQNTFTKIIYLWFKGCWDQFEKTSRENWFERNELFNRWDILEFKFSRFHVKTEQKEDKDNLWRWSHKLIRITLLVLILH